MSTRPLKKISGLSDNRSTQYKILYLLKTHGAMTAVKISAALGLTSMGARQHLLRHTHNKEVTSYLKTASKGRPKRYWLLTQNGQSHFPQRHADLTLELIDSIEQIFGATGLEKLIAVRETATFNKYEKRLAKFACLSDKLQALANIRTDEGYMACIENDGVDYLFIENHCPICAAAQKCQSFCRSELQMFQALFKNLAEIERIEHQIQGARRCAYKIKICRV